MVRHFLKITLRNIRKSGGISLLNILGLSIGLGSFLVIVLYLFQENSYEQGFTDNDRIYRVEEEFMSMGRVATSSPNLPFRLQDIALVEQQSRVSYLGRKAKVKIEEDYHSVDRLFSGDSSFFKLFDYEFVAGDPNQALTQPDQAVLNEETAMKLFGSLDVIGKTITSLDFGPYTVVGLVKNGVYKSHLDFGMMISERPVKYNQGAWFGIGGYSYVKLTQGSTQSDFHKALDEFTQRDVYPMMNPSKSVPFDEWLVGANKIRFISKPINDIYLSSNAQFEIGVNGDKQSRMTLTIISIFILIVASINFMNLTTAKSSQRTKEIGMRKVLGASKRTLVQYFLGEAIIITLFASIIGAGISELLIRLINQSLEGVINVSLVTYPILGVYLLLFVLFLGLFSGLYPAFFLSSAKMIPLLKGMKLGRVLNLRSAKVLRNGLVVLQFVISSTLIVSSILVYGQLKHLKNMDLGFDDKQVIVIKNMHALRDSKYAMRTELLRLPEVKQASFAHRLPGDGRSATTSTMLDSETSFTLSHFMTDEYLDETLGLKLIEGSWFEPGQVQHDSVIVINNTAARALGFDEPVGKIFGNYWTIKGVVEDFYFEGLKDAVGPAMFMYTPERHSDLAVKLNSLISIDKLSDMWNKFTELPFEYYYLDQNFENKLLKERQNAAAVLTFTGLAVLISCLGLFGLAAFTADQRLHEFGIRKVLGASVADIVKIFSFDFMKLVGIAFMISIPISIWGVNLWLESFANHISIGAGAFILAGILAIGIAFTTILFQSVKTGRLNPVDTIGNE